MNKKNNLYLRVLHAVKSILPAETDARAHGLGWAGCPCPHIRIEVYPDRDPADGQRAGGQPCHS